MALTADKLVKYTEALIVRAERSLAEAESNVVAGSYKVASSQSYYCMHGAAVALLAARGLDVHKRLDPEIVAMFAYHFVSTGNMEPEFRDSLQAAFKARLACGYDSHYTETVRNAEDLVEKAGEFLAASKKQLDYELQRLEGQSMRKGKPGEASASV